MQWIDNDSDMQLYMTPLLKKSVISIDTEFEHTSSFFPRPALLQIYDGDEAYLIDVLQLGDTSVALLKELLIAPNILKIFHSARCDLQVLWILCQAIARPVFDVQIATMISGGHPQSAYQSLVSDFLGVELAKTETRSNWLKRPLSEKQLSYAADDVYYLIKLKDTLSDKLKALDRTTWAEQDFNHLCDSVERAQKNPIWQPPASFPRMNGQPIKTRAIVRVLGNWREQEARRQDRPRTWVMSDKALLRIACAQPKTIRELINTCDVNPKHARRYGENLLTCVKNSVPLESDQAVRISKDEENCLVELVRTREQQMNFGGGVIASRAEARSFLHACKSGAPVQGRLSCPWRLDILTELARTQELIN